MNILFTIPIYYRTKDKYYKDEERYLHDILKDLKKWHKDKGEALLDKSKWPPWEFNDIIGYIRIFEHQYDISVDELLEYSTRRYYYYPAGHKYREGIFGNPEGSFLDFEKKYETLPISISRKTEKKLKDELIALLFELQDMKGKEGFYLHIDPTVRILKFLNLNKFIEN